MAAILAGAAWRAAHARRQVAEHRRSWQDDRQLETQQEARDAMSALVNLTKLLSAFMKIQCAMVIITMVAR